MHSEINDKLIHGELSYRIIGCAYEVHNTVGGGLLEKQYQKALAIEFARAEIKFQEQVHYPMGYKGELIGKRFLDFLVDDRVVVEIKRDEHFSRHNIEQVHGYLKLTGLELGLLIHFGREAVRFKRILNVQNPD